MRYIREVRIEKNLKSLKNGEEITLESKGGIQIHIYKNNQFYWMSHLSTYTTQYSLHNIIVELSLLSPLEVI